MWKTKLYINFSSKLTRKTAARNTRDKELRIILKWTLLKCFMVERTAVMELSARRLKTVCWSGMSAGLYSLYSLCGSGANIVCKWAADLPLHYLAVPFTKTCVSECVRACTQMGQSLYAVIKYRSDRTRLMYYTVQLQLCVCVHSERCNRLHGNIQPYELTKWEKQPRKELILHTGGVRLSVAVIHLCWRGCDISQTRSTSRIAHSDCKEMGRPSVI